MTISNKLGASFASVRDKLKTRNFKVTFDDAQFDLKVRIPLKHEMEAISERIQTPNAEVVEKIYKAFSTPLLATLEDAGETFLTALNEGEQKIVVANDDVIVNGTSMRQVAAMTAMWQTRVEQYFHLLQSDSGEPITESFNEIMAEFPEQVVKLIVDGIENAIKPDYQNAKKN